MGSYLVDVGGFWAYVDGYLGSGGGYWAEGGS